MAKKITSATKLVIPCRISFANIFEPKSINGSEAKYSVSCLIPKDDKKTLLAIHKAVEAAKEDGKVRKWGGKIPPNLKLPLRDGDIDRPDDETYQNHFFLNATSKDAPQVVDRHVQPIMDPMMVYLMATEGNVIHYGFIEKVIEELGKWYDAVYEPQAEAVDTEDTSHTEEPQG